MLSINNQMVPFSALTAIDTVTGLVELKRLVNKTSAHVAKQFKNCWWSQYPQPLNCIHDQGGEFTGYSFQQLLHRHDIHSHAITAKNFQANAICEGIYQTVSNCLWAMVAMNPRGRINTANQLVNSALANCVFATHTAMHGSIKASSGSLAFGRNMVLDIPVISDRLFIQQRRQQLIDERLIAANRKRFSYDYQPGQEVLKLAYKPIWGLLVLVDNHRRSAFY